MKKLILINGLTLVLAIVSGAAFAASSDAAGDKTTSKDAKTTKPAKDMKYNMGYFFGYSFGNMLKQGGNEDVNLDALHKGMSDSLANKIPDMTRDEQQAVIEVLQAQRKKHMDEEKQAQAEADKKESEQADKNEKDAMEFLKANGKKPGVMTTASGLQYKIIKKGTGASPTADDRVSVNYIGKLADGTVFDASKDHGGPAKFGLKQVIPGWTEGLQLMKEGGSMEFYIPPDLGYGPGGTHGIPPNSVLIFDVDLLKVNPKD